MDPWYPLLPPFATVVPPQRRDLTGDDGPTPGLVRGVDWRASSRGLHVPASVQLTVEQRIIEAGARLVGPAMVTGWGALRLAGAAFFEGQRRAVPVLLPHASRIRAPGVEVRRTRLPLPTPVLRYGLPCAPAAVALVHELRRERDFRELVVMIEMALLAKVVTWEEVREQLEATRRVHTRHFDALGLAKGECRSPPEVRMRLVWELDAHFGPPLMNREVLDVAGRRIAVVDLLDVESGTYGEYDGEAHRGRARHQHDVERAEVLRDVGLEGFTIVAGNPTAVQVQRMRAARRRALWLPEEQRRWRVGRHVPMKNLMRPSTREERELLRPDDERWDDSWGTIGLRDQPSTTRPFPNPNDTGIKEPRTVRPSVNR